MDVKEGESLGKCDNCKTMQAVCRENVKVSYCKIVPAV